ncbi:MAG: SCO family protein [Opitutaceae bacterium]|nr:SCO family protein [Opitutaceae bacterium]
MSSSHLRLTATLLALAVLLPGRSLLAGDSPASETKAACCQPAPKAACCAAKAEPKPAACCSTATSAEAAAPFTSDSLYQLEAAFTDDTGKAFSLGELRGRPVALNLFFASCGYACPLTVTDLLAIQSGLPAELRSRTAFVLVSFDTARDTTAVLAQYRAQRGLDSNWIILRGSDDAVRELAALVGVKYKQEADGSFAHSNLVTILNAQGEIVHQRQGLKGGLEAAAAALAK